MSQMISNDTMQLAPVTQFDGPALEFDFPAFQVGVAEYAEGPTGCTIFHFPTGAATAIDIRGGYPGTCGSYTWNHAICLAGGSLYGLEAAAGVQAELFAQRNYSTEWGSFALVSGAIIYDYGSRTNTIYPDKALGRAAMRTVRPGWFPPGPRGAGCSASCGWFATEPSGQGGAFRQVGPVKIAVFTVVNACGAIVNRQNQVIRGNLDSATGRRHTFIDELERHLADGAATTPPHGNTTLTVVITNQRLDAENLRQVARQVHSSLARAIQPFHTLNDGDVLYAVTTAEVEHPALRESATLGALASEVAWDAVLSCVPTGDK